eukprot:365466-Chlamydomonas_euryale.AAC.9
MPQKPLLKAGKTIGKKAAVANKHGKGSSTRKGQFSKPPKGGAEKQRYLENKKGNKIMNHTNCIHNVWCCTGEPHEDASGHVGALHSFLLPVLDILQGYRHTPHCCDDSEAFPNTLFLVYGNVKKPMCQPPGLQHWDFLRFNCLLGCAFRIMQELSKVINRTNESNLAAVAENKGGKLKAVSFTLFACAYLAEFHEMYLQYAENMLTGSLVVHIWPIFLCIALLHFFGIGVFVACNTSCVRMDQCIFVHASTAVQAHSGLQLGLVMATGSVHIHVAECLRGCTSFQAFSVTSRKCECLPA